MGAIIGDRLEQKIIFKIKKVMEIYAVGQKHVVTKEFIKSKEFETYKDALEYKNSINKRFKTKSFIVKKTKNNFLKLIK